MLKELGFLRKALAFAMTGAYSPDKARMAVREETADGYPYPVSPCRSRLCQTSGSVVAVQICTPENSFLTGPEE